MKFRSIRIWTVQFFFGDSKKPFLECLFFFQRRAKAFMIERSKSFVEFEEGEQVKVQMKMERLWI